MNLVYHQPIFKTVEVLKNISFEVKKGELICLGGANGSGKSTLLYAICRKMQLDTGSIEVNGSIFAFLGSAPPISDRKPGIDLLLYMAQLYGHDKQIISDNLITISRLSGLPIKLIKEQPIYTYSRGMLARLQATFPMCLSMDINLFDETLAAPDRVYLDCFFETMKSNLQQGNSYIIVHHSENIWRRIAKCGGRFLILGQQSLLYNGYDVDRAAKIYRDNQMFVSTLPPKNPIIGKQKKNKLLA